MYINVSFRYLLSNFLVVYKNHVYVQEWHARPPTKFFLKYLLYYVFIIIFITKKN